MTESIPGYKQREIWLRGLYMLLFLVIHGLVKGIVLVVAVVQFVITLFSETPNLPLRKFGQGLSTYLYDTTQFLMYNTENKPFPFSDWRQEPPEVTDVALPEVESESTDAS